MKEAILLTDGYKLDHRRQYPENTEYVYSNWTPRSCHYYPEATEGAVVFGIQYFIKEYLMKELIRHARKTGFKDVDLNFLIHDFSMRGMGHMTSFCGSETIPAIAGLEEYYNADADKELIAATIPDAEHSVMCAGGKEDELETFRRLITEIYPTGFVSIVSDTWDFWKVMTEYLPKLKDDRYIAEDQVTKEQEDKSCLQTVFEDGKLVKEWSLRQIRDNVNNSIVLED